MKKTLKTILSVVLALAMVMSVAVCAFADGHDNLKGKYLVYTCLGDSNAAGYGTTGFISDRVPAPNAYHSILSRELGAKLNVCGGSAYRVHELRDIIDPNYEITDFTYADGCTNDPLYRENLDQRIDLYTAAVKEADLITLNIGGNNFFSMVKNAYVASYQTDDQTFLEAEERIYSIGSVFDPVSEDYPMVEKAARLVEFAVGLADFLNFFIGYLPTVYSEFFENWDGLVGAIYDMNPDVTLVAFSVNNPFNSTTLNTGDSYPIGSLMDVFYGIFNAWIKYGSEYADSYIYCDNTDIRLGEGLAFTQPDFKPAFYVPVHADDNEVIVSANRVLDLLSAKEAGETAVTPWYDGIVKFAFKLFK